MIPIRNRTFESDDTADKAFSKLDWKIEKVDRLTNPLLGSSTVDTVRPWVGKINRGKKEFKITQTAPIFSPRFLRGNFFHVFIHGQIVEEGLKSKIILEFRLGLQSSLLFVLMYLFSILTIFDYVKPDHEGHWTGLLGVLVVPVLFTCLLIWQLNRAENKLIDLFGV